jgi:hypothetical protein
LASQEVISKLKKASSDYGVPSWIVSSIVEHESGFNPKAHGDIGLGKSGSWGLFQLYTGNGHGKGFSPDRLTNIDTNISLAMPHLKKGYEGAKAKGLTGFDLLKETASRSGWPLMTGNMPSSYAKGLEKTFDNGDELSGIGGSSKNDLTYQKADVGTWVTGKTQNISNELLGRLAMMGKTYNEKVVINSGFRSYQEQKILYDSYKAGTGNVAAIPGSSKHEKGLAVDIENPNLQAKSDEIFKSFGLHRPVFSPQRELWHIELWNGGTGGGFSTGEIRETLKNGFDKMGIKELSQGSYSLFSSLDKMSQTQPLTDEPSISNGFGIPNFINSSGKAIAFRSVVVLIGLLIISMAVFKSTKLSDMVGG